MYLEWDHLKMCLKCIDIYKDRHTVKSISFKNGLMDQTFSFRADDHYQMANKRGEGGRDSIIAKICWENKIDTGTNFQR
jgi:hypothetical protein